MTDTKSAAPLLTLSILASLALPSDGHALLGSDACRRVTFTVNNELNGPIEVRRFELFSVDEGRWLNENFRDVLVPAGARAFVVRRGETVEYAEGDSISRIRVHYRRWEDDGWVNREAVDRDIARQECVADKTYNATVS